MMDASITGEILPLKPASNNQAAGIRINFRNH